MSSLLPNILFAPDAPEQNPVGDTWLRWFYYTCQSFKQAKVLFEWFIDHRILISLSFIATQRCRERAGGGEHYL